MWVAARCVVSLVLAGLSVTLLGTSAYAVEGARREAEATCSGGSIQSTSAAFSGTGARGSSAGAAVVTCPVPAAAGGVLARFYGLRDSSARGVRVTAQPSGTVVLSTGTNTLNPANNQALHGSGVIPAGTTSFTFAGTSSSLASWLDFWTHEEPDPPPPTTPPPTTPPPATEPPPTTPPPTTPPPTTEPPPTTPGPTTPPPTTPPPTTEPPPVEPSGSPTCDPYAGLVPYAPPGATAATGCSVRLATTAPAPSPPPAGPQEVTLTADQWDPLRWLVASGLFFAIAHTVRAWGSSRG